MHAKLTSKTELLECLNSRRRENLLEEGRHWIKVWWIDSSCSIRLSLSCYCYYFPDIERFKNLGHGCGRGCRWKSSCHDLDLLCRRVCMSGCDRRGHLYQSPWSCDCGLDLRSRSSFLQNACAYFTHHFWLISWRCQKSAHFLKHSFLITQAWKVEIIC